MKSSFLAKLLCSSLMVVALAGCGKDEKSSSEGSSASPYVGFVPVNSQQAFTSFQAWYNSATEGQFPGVGYWKEYRSVTTYPAANDGCKDKPISIGGFSLGSVNYCFNQNVSGLTNNLQPRDVNLTTSPAKSSNPKLVEAVSGNGLTLYQASQISGKFGSPAYALEYQNTTTGRTVVYIIDTGVHSAFNPVQIINNDARTVEVVNGINH